MRFCGLVVENLFSLLSRRQRRCKLQMFFQLFRPSESTLVLDVGISDKEYRSSDNFFSKEYPYPERVIALGIGDLRNFKQCFRKVAVVRYNGQQFPFKNGVFDIVFSNAVIEHVGGFTMQQRFIEESLRVGKAVFITTPNRYFPVELHTKLPFLHYLPKKPFHMILNFLGMSWASGNYMNLLSLKEFRSLFPAGSGVHIFKNRLLGLPVTFTAVVGRR